ncbi:MAG: PIG-L family deacetylase, partial [Gammaproteobacteria bacterium]|nr:PIG-L family deacetylase [Gammaproteobacteria bacterium]
YSENASEQRLFQAKIRTLDSITVPMQGGVAPDRAVNLSYFNNTLDQMHKEPMAPVKSLVTEVDDINQFRKLNFSSLLPVSNGKATWQNLLVDLRYLIEHIKPDTIILPHPWLDKHPDHRLSALAIFMALKDSSFKSGNFLFYVTHSTLSTKYPYGPRHSPITVPPNFIKDQLKYSVFSYPLSHEQQIEKLFALDSMHDISTIPGTIYDFKWLLHQLLTNKGHGNQPWLGYYRKAVRANELFLVVPFSETQKLINLTEAVIKQ